MADQDQRSEFMLPYDPQVHHLRRSNPIIPLLNRIP